MSSISKVLNPRSYKLSIIVALIGIFIAVSPIIPVLTAGVIAGIFSCPLDEGSVHPCIIAGYDMGDTLYAMGVMGWGMLATLPLGGFLFALSAITFVAQLIWRIIRINA